MGSEDTCASCNELAELEAIKQLKARYFRLMDNQDWSQFEEVFAREAVVSGGTQAITGRSRIVEFVAMTAKGARTAHQGFMPEIEILGDGRARGVWAMSDYFEVRGTVPPVGFTGFGHYIDEYVREDGAWRISSSRLTRIKILPFAGGLPDLYRRD